MLMKAPRLAGAVSDPDRYRALGSRCSAAKLRAMKLEAMGPTDAESKEIKSLWLEAGDMEIERLALVGVPSPWTEARARLEAIGCYRRAGEITKEQEQRNIVEQKGLPT